MATSMWLSPYIRCGGSFEQNSRAAGKKKCKRLYRNISLPFHLSTSTNIGNTLCIMFELSFSPWSPFVVSNCRSFSTEHWLISNRMTIVTISFCAHFVDVNRTHHCRCSCVDGPWLGAHYLLLLLCIYIYEPHYQYMNTNVSFHPKFFPSPLLLSHSHSLPAYFSRYGTISRSKASRHAASAAVSYLLNVVFSNFKIEYDYYFFCCAATRE